MWPNLCLGFCISSPDSLVLTAQKILAPFSPRRRSSTNPSSQSRACAFEIGDCKNPNFTIRVESVDGMGGKCPHRSVKKRRYSHKTARRTKFLLKGDDAVYDELQRADRDGKSLPVDEDLPGMGQYYCLHCDRYFANVAVRDEHFKTKRHKKRLKQMMGPAPHTQLDADLAAGMGMPENGPKLMST